MSIVDPLQSSIDADALPARRSLSDDIVDRLRAAIVRGVFVPGQRLSEAAMAKTFAVSRGPIREAFALLEREGLLTLEPHRGARVTSLSLGDIDEIYGLRVALERLAIERACVHATAADFATLELVVDGLRDATARADVVQVVELDVRFHDAIYVAAKHERLYRAWSMLRPQIETFLISRSADQHDYLDKSVREHRAILNIIRARRRAVAVRAIEEHIKSAYERLTNIAAARGDA